MKKEYAIAWTCLLHCLRNNYPLSIWICPIPPEHKQRMLEAGKKIINHERLSNREPFLFEGESNVEKQV